MTLSAIDQQLTQRIESWGRPHYTFWRLIAGNGMWLLALAAVVLVLTEHLHVFHVFLPLLTSYVLALGLQSVFRRERPGGSSGGYKLWYKTFSCPSAHSLTSAAYSTVLAFTPLGDPTLQALFIVFLIVVTLAIGISRLVVRVHYLFDVLFGLFLGVFFGLGYVLLFSAGTV